MHCIYININARSCNYSCHGKAVSVTCSECVFVALVIQHAMRLRRLYCHLWPGRLYHVFPHFLVNDTIFRRKLIGYKFWVVISLKILSENFLILPVIQRDI
jgi:hypothetical protein